MRKYILGVLFLGIVSFFPSFSFAGQTVVGKFEIGDRVETTSDLNVRTYPSLNGLSVDIQDMGNTGTVIGGSTFADNIYWWNVNYDNGQDGWSAEDYLTLEGENPLPPPPPTGVTGSPKVDLKANGSDGPLNVTHGEPVVFTWTASGVSSSTKCQLFDTLNNPGVTFGNTSGTQTINYGYANYPREEGWTYNIICTNGGVQVASDSIKVTDTFKDFAMEMHIEKAVTGEYLQQISLNRGDELKLAWTADTTLQFGSLPNLSCTASGPGGFSGSKPANGTATITIGSSQKHGVYKIVCIGNNNLSREQEVTVNINQDNSSTLTDKDTPDAYLYDPKVGLPSNAKFLGAFCTFQVPAGSVVYADGISQSSIYHPVIDAVSLQQEMIRLGITGGFPFLSGSSTSNPIANPNFKIPSTLHPNEAECKALAAPKIDLKMSGDNITYSDGPFSVGSNQGLWFKYTIPYQIWGAMDSNKTCILSRESQAVAYGGNGGSGNPYQNQTGSQKLGTNVLPPTTSGTTYSLDCNGYKDSVKITGSGVATATPPPATTPPPTTTPPPSGAVGNCAPGELYNSQTGQPCPGTGGGAFSSGSGSFSVKPGSLSSNFITLTANKTSIVKGEALTFTWTTTGVTSCSSIDFYVPQGASLSGVATVYPSKVGAYTISCFKSTGLEREAISIGSTTSSTIPGGGTYVPPATPPTGTNNSIVTLTANPATINSGQSSRLYWTTNIISGGSCSIVGMAGNMYGSASIVVTPTATTTYTMNCYNVPNVVAGTASATVTVGSTANTPASIGLSNSFKAGDRVKSNTVNVNARSAPNGSVIKMLSKGELGTIKNSTPMNTGFTKNAQGGFATIGYTWWEVALDSGGSAWVAEQYIDPATGFPWHVPTWEELVEMYPTKMPNYVQGQGCTSPNGLTTSGTSCLAGTKSEWLQQTFPGFSTEGAELTLYLNGIPGGQFFTSDLLATGVYVGTAAAQNENSAMTQLERMLQGGVPRVYVAAQWERAKRISRDTTLPNYETARQLTFGSKAWPTEVAPPRVSADNDPVHYMNSSTDWPKAGEWKYYTGGSLILVGPPGTGANYAPCPVGYVPNPFPAPHDSYSGTCVTTTASLSALYSFAAAGGLVNLTAASLPAGCVGFFGYSPTTGGKCSSNLTSAPGIVSGNITSPPTGLPFGCSSTSGTAEISVTGTKASCAVKNGCINASFNVITGQACSN